MAAIVTAAEITRMGWIYAKNTHVEIDRLIFASYGMHAMNYFASLGIFYAWEMQDAEETKSLWYGESLYVSDEVSEQVWVKEWIYHLVLKIAVHYASWLKTTRLESSLLSFTKHFIMEGVHCLLLNRHCLLPHFLEMLLMTDMEKKIPCDRWSEWAIVSGRVNIPSCIKNIRSLRFTVKTRSPWIFTSIVYETFYFFGSTLFIAEQCLFFPLLHAEKVCSKGIRGYLQADYMVDSWEGYKLCDVACLHFHCITNYKFCIEFAIPHDCKRDRCRSVSNRAALSGQNFLHNFFYFNGMVVKLWKELRISLSSNMK